MKLFFKRILFYASVVFIYLLINLIINFQYETYPKIGNKNIIFLGDSHMRNSINPDSFFNAVNFGLNADPLIGQKWKLVGLLNNNKIDTIVISLGYHNFIDSIDIFFTSESSKADENLFRYNLINNRELCKLNLSKRKYLFSLFRKMQKPVDLSYVGSFFSENMVMKDSAKSAISRRLSNDTAFKFSNLITIEIIRKFCESKGIKCLFLFTPTSSYYNSKVPVTLKVNVDRYIFNLKQKGALIDINYNFNDNLFFDGDHLNIHGSELFTHLVKVKLYRK